MTVRIRKLSFIGLSIFVVMIFAASKAWALEVQANANVRITQAISLSEIQAVEFGAIANGNGQCTINQAGTILSANGLCVGDGTLGIIQLKAQAGSRININATSGGSDGITFNPLLSHSSLVINNNGDAVQIPIAGTLDIALPQNGLHNIPFEITANYE